MSETVSHYYPVSWEQLHRDAKALAWRLAERGPFARIVAITRGGLVPAHIIARELDIRIIDTVCISSYDVETQRAAEVLKPIAGDGDGWLIVDDLVDTGATGRIVREMLPQAPTSPPSTPSPPAARWSTPSSPRSARTPGFCSHGTRSRNTRSRSRAGRPGRGPDAA